MTENVMVLTTDHILLDLHVTEPLWLERFEPMQALLHDLLSRETDSLQVVGERFHQFQPHGYTGYVLLAQSHISVHSWVDERLLTMDILACAPGVSERVADWLIDRIQPQRERRVLVRRGEDDRA